MYELARKKQWQDKAREEFLSVLGEGSDKYPSKDVLEKLPICMSIWKETLRMHPISLGVLRETGPLSPLHPSSLLWHPQGPDGNMA